jgi:hypothetical protein
MLKKLYVKGTLAPDGRGFRFTLKNTLATASLVAPPDIFLDGERVEPNFVGFIVAGKELDAKMFGADKPFVFAKGMEVVVATSKPTLRPGAHKLRLKVKSKEWEEIDFEVEDTA